MFARVPAVPLINNPAMQQPFALVKKKYQRLVIDENHVLEGFITCYNHQNNLKLPKQTVSTFKGCSSLENNSLFTRDVIKSRFCDFGKTS